MKHTRLLRVVMVLTLAACSDGTDPMAPEREPEPSAGIVATPPTIPVPAELRGCGERVTYDTGDPANPTALYQICWPETWNGSFVAYAHGYVSAFEPLAIPAEAAELAAFVGAQNFAFASTSYRVNGLAIREGTEDLATLAQIARATAGTLFPSVGPVPVLAAGASEGGAVATLAAERFPGLFQGALATCGPTGDFQRQLDYVADFNVLFNYFFPAVFSDGAGGFLVTPEGVRLDPVADWGDPAEGVWGPRSQFAAAQLAANPGKARQLLAVAGVAHDPNDPQSTAGAIFGLLWYNVYATNDANAKLGDSPYDNRFRWYRGSSNDWTLNRRVERYVADPAARAMVAQHYQTSGKLQMPYVSLHTTGDEIVEFWQQPRYRLKAVANGSANEHSAIPVLRYGHCNFEDGDLTVGIALLLLKVRATTPTVAADAMPASAASTFWRVVGR